MSETAGINEKTLIELQRLSAMLAKERAALAGAEEELNALRTQHTENEHARTLLIQRTMTGRGEELCYRQSSSPAVLWPVAAAEALAGLREAEKEQKEALEAAEKDTEASKQAVQTLERHLSWVSTFAGAEDGDEE